MSGRQPLKEVAQRIERCVRHELLLPVSEDEALQPVVARFEGDEFMVLLPTVPSVESVAGVAHQMLEVCAPAYNADGRELFMTVSVGVAVFPDDGEDADTIVKRAGLAHSHVKDAGRNSYKFFSPDLDARALQRLGLQGMLRRALERGELELFYQPKLDIKGGHVTGAEALLRWRHPERGLLAPAEFIDLADEKAHRAHRPLGAETACEQAGPGRKRNASGHRIGEHFRPAFPRAAVRAHGARSARLDRSGALPEAGGQRNRDDRQCEPGICDSRAPQGVGASAVDRRFRHRLLGLQIPEGIAGG